MNSEIELYAETPTGQPIYVSSPRFVSATSVSSYSLFALSLQLVFCMCASYPEHTRRKLKF